MQIKKKFVLGVNEHYIHMGDPWLCFWNLVAQCCRAYWVLWGFCGNCRRPIKLWILQLSRSKIYRKISIGFESVDKDAQYWPHISNSKLYNMLPDSLSSICVLHQPRRMPRSWQKINQLYAAAASQESSGVSPRRCAYPGHWSWWNIIDSISLSLSPWKKYFGLEGDFYKYLYKLIMRTSGHETAMPAWAIGELVQRLYFARVPKASFHLQSVHDFLHDVMSICYDDTTSRCTKKIEAIAVCAILILLSPNIDVTRVPWLGKCRG